MKKCKTQNQSGSNCCSSLSKRLYLLVFLMIALVAMIWISGCNSNVVKKSDSASDVAEDYNLVMPIPPENIGDLEKIPPEKLDSLFSDLKK